MPTAPIDGILTLDTRVVTERGADYCAIFDPELEDCGFYSDDVYRDIWFCRDASCSSPIEEINVNEGFLRVRLKAESNYADFFSNTTCNEFGELWLTYGAGQPGGYQLAYIIHKPQEDNHVGGTYGGSFVIYNNGTFAEYVIPIDIGLPGPVYAIDIFARDSRGIYDEGVGFTCHDAYFSIDIDYIDFIP